MPSSRVMSSPDLHKTTFFSESCLGDLMLLYMLPFASYMIQWKEKAYMALSFLAFANIWSPFQTKCWVDDITCPSCNVVTPLYSRSI
jgi:hypothetical protein